MKLSKNNPIIRLTRWLILRKGLQRRVPTIIRYGGWLLLYVYSLAGIKVLLLTTTGRRSGKLRTVPVMYVNQGPDYVVCAHQAGSDRHPSWYLNLQANRSVTVELFWRRRAFQAEEIEDETEKLALLAQFPFGLVETFQEHTERAMPVIRLRPLE